MRRKIMLFTLAFAALFMFPAGALADAVSPQPTLALPSDQVWTLFAGALVPLVGYVLNHYGPQASEKAKAFVQVIAAAIAGGIIQAITAGHVGFNMITLQFILTAVIAALTAHGLLWRPSGISTALGAGRNA